ncbi:radical SAM domain protein protein [Alloactinosynnema sp. L-07]|uniref:radical SAM protein n=1 Tax=Alloactinosynnema sp. L-07 TaxID=1653480 RepID=UPI00065F0921|nr:radical SAM protein [Alloactinosynnema sp. L-07]CRK61866.1 radical SAM domain protein protein [Alloactinosynnema sp. L-07]
MTAPDSAALISRVKATGAPVVLFGAGDVGKIAWWALTSQGVEVTCFSDGRAEKHGTSWSGVEIRSPEQLAALSRDAHVFICANYLFSMPKTLGDMGFTNIHHAADLLDGVDFTGADIGMDPVFIERKVALHVRETHKAREERENSLVLKYLDVVVTEACSMKCQDCSNLMQYYTKPRHSDLDLLGDAVDRIVDSIDRIYEFRVLGGEPFVNPKAHRVINQLTAYPTVEKVVIYTNATIVPKGEMLEALRNPKIVVDITNYGQHSRKLEPLREVLTDNGIDHLVKIPEWTDSGRINFVERDAAVLDDMFANCCVNDILTLLNGKLYRCPFSANGTNLGAMPITDAEVVDLTGPLSGLELRERIRALYSRRTHLTACEYCNGRDYRTPKIDPAIQTRRPLPLVSVT